MLFRSVLLIPVPGEGHVNPLPNLAKLLHSRGFHITFVNTEYIHSRLLQSYGPSALRSLEDFRFETIPDGLPLYDDVTRDIPTLCFSNPKKNRLSPFRSLILKINISASEVPPLTCIISDGVMGLTLDIAKVWHP